MKILQLDCNHCGAPLEVSTEARFVTCNYCSARLVVRQEPSAAWTEVLDELRGSVRGLECQRKLDALDREWNERQSAGRLEGEPHVAGGPTVGSAVGVMLLWIGLGFLLMVWGFGAGPGFFGVLGLSMMVGGLISGSRRWALADRYAEAQKEYLERRSRLLAELGEVASDPPPTS